MIPGGVIHNNLDTTATASRKMLLLGATTSSASNEQDGAEAVDIRMGGDDDDEDDKTLTISKVKWKKKRFLLIKDVNKAIQSNNPRAARKAQEVVRRMWQLYDLAGNDDDFKPDLQAYNLWIHAVAKSKDKNSGQQAEDIIAEMQKRNIAPNVVSFTNVMDAYANQARFDSKAPEHAERVLFHLIERSEVDHSLAVTPVTADVAMNAWAQQGTWQGAMRAQQILDRMEGMSSRRSLRPTVHSYGTVIHGWAMSQGGTEAAQRAERVLNSLLRGDKGVDPDTIVFNAVIDAWSSSGDARAGSKALSLLNKMKELSKTKGYGCEPDVVTYNTVSKDIFDGALSEIYNSIGWLIGFFEHFRSCRLGHTAATLMRLPKRRKSCNQCWKHTATSRSRVQLPIQFRTTASCTLGVGLRQNLL